MMEAGCGIDITESTCVACEKSRSKVINSPESALSLFGPSVDRHVSGGSKRKETEIYDNGLTCMWLTTHVT